MWKDIDAFKTFIKSFNTKAKERKMRFWTTFEDFNILLRLKAFANHK